MALPPNSELVAQAWISSLANISSSIVKTQLPADNTTWAASGFVHVVGVVGGASDPYVPVKNPVVQVDTYAVNPNTDNPDWGQASTLAEYIRAGTYLLEKTHVSLTTRSGFDNAQVLQATCTEPRRIPNDPSGYARYTMDVNLTWVTIGS